jgi:hypothetical protein
LPQQTAFGTSSYRRIVIRTSLAGSLVGSPALRPFASTSQGPRLRLTTSAGGARGWSNWRNASEGFHQASRNYAQASCDIETVQAGRQAATSGRSEDIISAYQALRHEAQAAFRSRHVGVERTCTDQPAMSPFDPRRRLLADRR